MFKEQREADTHWSLPAVVPGDETLNLLFEYPGRGGTVAMVFGSVLKRWAEGRAATVSDSADDGFERFVGALPGNLWPHLEDSGNFSVFVCPRFFSSNICLARRGIQDAGRDFERVLSQGGHRKSDSALGCQHRRLSVNPRRSVYRHASAQKQASGWTGWASFCSEWVQLG